ncbi:MAG: hypothetical protein ACRDPY_00685 [Streptosporangiaceae bacterium]
MALTITDTAIISDQTAHTARPAPGRPRGWHVSWLPGETLDRNTATTAMILADIAGTGDIRPGDRLWPVVERWAADLSLTGSDALTQASQPSNDTGRNPRQTTWQPDLEAGD